jgi:hypothetical protein
MRGCLPGDVILMVIVQALRVPLLPLRVDKFV